MKQSRINQIEQYVILNGNVKIEDLCKEFSVSINTIRRDLDELVKRGRVAKIYGGVTAIEKDTMPIDEKIHKNVSSKIEVAKLALDFIENGDTIFIDSGTTAVNIINFLATKSKITIITHSLNVLAEAAKYKKLNVIGLGGTYLQETGAFVGISALDMLSSIKINKAFMSATGFSIDNGFSVNTLLEAEIKRKIVSRSNDVYFLCDHTKIGIEATMSFCDIERVQALITDQKPSKKYEDYFKSHDVSVIYPAK
ncbi:MAG: DeoR/GlpR family DNA-binding transcription regulator [Clostridia bacterium]